MQKALLDLEKGKATDPEIRKTYDFYSGAVGKFKYFKDSWRNIISHSHEIGDSGRTAYLEGETADIIEETRRYIQHLAKRISE